MKIVCDSCSTKYSISDDKVRGKVFKIRCKKCSHIIVVRGTTEGAAAAAPEAPTEGVWHLVVDGEQVGPLTDADVRARVVRGDVSAENYIWKEGFADWLKLGAIPDFQDALPQAPTSGELFSNGSAGEAADANAGFFGGGVAGQEARAMASAGGGHSGPTSAKSGRNRAAAAAMATAEEDAFTAPPPASMGADLFGAAAPEPARGRGSNGTAAARHDGGRVENLTAQRSENSVLFSLSNLQSLAAPAMAKPVAKEPSAGAVPSTTQTTEGSGLIDIRAMAASTLKPAPSAGPVFGGASAETAEDDLPSFGAFSAAAPVLLPMSTPSGAPKWVYILIGIGVLLIVALSATAWSILRKPVVAEQPPPPPAPAVAAKPAPAAPAKAADKGAEQPPVSAPMAEGDLPPREGGAKEGAAEAGGDKPADKKGGRRGAKGAKGAKGAPAAAGDKAAGGGTAVAAAAPATPTGPPETAGERPAKGSLDDLLDRALNKKGEPKVKDDGGGARKPDKNVDRAAAAESAGGGSPLPLQKSAVVAGMNALKPKISACYAQFKVPGLVMVKVTIGKKGKVDAATATGKFAGTPSGGCVEQAVRTASFPPSDGLTTEYPFNLR